MRVLLAAESYPPARDGVAEQTRRIAEELSRLGDTVGIATGHPDRQQADGPIREYRFAVHGQAATGLHGDVAGYQRLLTEHDAEVFAVLCAQQWTADAAFPVLPRMRAKRVFVPVGLSGLHHPTYRNYYRDLPQHLRQFDAHILLSSSYQDATFLRQHGIGPTFVIPNGASLEEFSLPRADGWRERHGITTRHLIVLVGNHTNWKGHVEAMRILERSGILDATLLIIGRATDDHPGLRHALRHLIRHRIWNRHGPGCRHLCQAWSERITASRWAKDRHVAVRLAELPRPDVVQALMHADLMLFPSNIECSPIVLFEAAAAGLPFLTTDVGNAREIAGWTGGGDILPTRRLWRGLRAADIDGSADMLARRLADSTWLQACRERAQAAWRQHFTWERIAARYREVMAATVAGDAARLASSWQVVPSRPA